MKKNKSNMGIWDKIAIVFLFLFWGMGMYHMIVVNWFEGVIIWMLSAMAIRQIIIHNILNNKMGRTNTKEVKNERI